MHDRRASEPVGFLGDRPLACRYLKPALSYLRRPVRTADTGDVPLFLTLMALALLDEHDLNLPAARAQRRERNIPEPP